MPVKFAGRAVKNVPLSIIRKITLTCSRNIPFSTLKDNFSQINKLTDIKNIHESSGVEKFVNVVAHATLNSDGSGYYNKVWNEKETRYISYFMMTVVPSNFLSFAPPVVRSISTEELMMACSAFSLMLTASCESWFFHFLHSLHVVQR